MARCQKLFLALILTQAAHPVEEHVFRLYDVLQPARVVRGLISDDLAFGFAASERLAGETPASVARCTAA